MRVWVGSGHQERPAYLSDSVDTLAIAVCIERCSASLRGTMAHSHYQLVFTTCPDAAAAETIARALVEDRLAACVNVLPPMRSIYRWRGQTESAEEQLLIVKIRVRDYPAVEQRIVALHPYELPEVVAIPIAAGLAGYLAWIEDPESAT
ncbi:MAG TPA: divalent-cation tolerance protein CutA [Burkholderiales bacterium]